ncbi:endonuclease MutS2 [Atopococcus tabaci]|uniref:endonuclease MutS2 n=1 Tax=Atopococcus tabaci TaxID=269774 RepID=UPI000486713C|nr:endonuclease MutS2 [Atopococcus tabaci]
MENRKNKILETMEFHKVIERLASHTVSEVGKSAAFSLAPSSNYEEILRWQEETEDGVKLLRVKGGLPISRFENVRPHLKRLNIGASLNGQEIAQIGHILEVVREMQAFFDNLEEEQIELSRLYGIASEFVPLNQLAKHIRNVVDLDGRVLDDASQKLRGIRTGIKQGESRVREKLESIVRGKSAKYLTDTIITIRNDRFVIPVKQENRGHFGGVVHDQSSTGQTLFIEPQSVVELNNRLRQLQIEERHEIDRILAEVSNEIAPHTAEIQQNIDTLGKLDFINAKARYAQETDATRPLISQDNVVKMYQARHPLIDPADVVANDLLIGDEYQAVIVTGPNTGGKTVVLKTLGLLQLMGQSGLQLPVEQNSQMGIFDAIFADIGDEQSIEQSLSTFSSHMTNVVSILEQMDERSLILLDELGAGTDPQEGAALAISMLDKIGEAGSTVMVTSHYPELKAYGYNRPKTVNASMEFNVDTLSPTYRLLIGVPGRSNAFEIARRLGLDPSIIDNAKNLMSGESQSVDEMIHDLENKRKMAEMEYLEMRDYLDEAAKLHRDLKQAVQEFWDERDGLMKKAQTKANAVVEKAQEEAEKVIRDLRNKQMEIGTADGVKEHELIDARTRLANMRTEEEKLAKNKVLRKEKKKQQLQPGDDVEVLSFGQRGTLIEKAGNKQWVVQMGSLKMKLNESDLTLIAKQEEPEPKVRTVRSGSAAHVSTELDLRGERYEAAMAQLDRYLDAALLANYPKVTIIHGVGTGAIRKGVQEALKKHPQVKTFQMAPANQGGAGATIVSFKS